MTRRICQAGAVLCVLAAVTMPAAAGTADDDTTIRINIDARTRTNSSTHKEEKLRTAKAGRNNVELRSNSRLELAIEDYNPLLYDYTLKKDPPVDTADFNAALEFAKTLAKLLTSLSKAAEAGALTINGFSPSDFRTTVTSIQTVVAKVPVYIGRTSRGPAEVALVRADVAKDKIEENAKAIERGYEQVAVLLHTCQSDTPVVKADNGEMIDCNVPMAWALSNDRVTREKTVADAKAAVDALKLKDRDMRAKVEELRGAPGTTPSAAVQATITELNATIKKNTTDLADLKKKQDEAQDRLAAAREGVASKSQTLLLFLRDVNDDQSKLVTQIALLRDFSKDLALVNQVTVIETPFDYSLKDQPATLTVISRTRYEKARSGEADAAVKKNIGDYLFTVHPYQPAHFSVGGAAVAGLFIKNPTFTAVKDGDAFAIKRKDDDPAMFKVAAMLNITPAKWSEPTFGGFFQLGITPDPGNYGFYLGTGIRAQSVFSFGVGLMLQQVQKLGPGLTMDTRLDDPAKLKTVSEFKPGLYFHITATLPK